MKKRYDFSDVSDEQWKRASDQIKRDVENRKVREKRKEIKIVERK